MRELKDNRGWKYIQENYVLPILSATQMRLLSDTEVTEDEQRTLKHQWKLYKKFSEYPEFIIAKETGIAPGEANPDPYERADEQ